MRASVPDHPQQACTSVLLPFRNQVAARLFIRYDRTHVLTSVHHHHGVLLLPVLSCVDAWRNEELVAFHHSALLRPTVAAMPVGFLFASCAPAGRNQRKQRKD